MEGWHVDFEHREVGYKGVSHVTYVHQRTLEWIQPAVRHPFQWLPTLDFVTLSSIYNDGVQSILASNAQSTALCQFQETIGKTNKTLCAFVCGGWVEMRQY